jgi:ATP/maltotriose-dependent transcriptional regulator MalT
MLYLTGDGEEGARYLEGAAHHDDPQVTAVCATLRAYARLLHGDADTAKRLAGEALELMGDRSDSLRVLALSFLAQAQVTLGEREAAIVSLREAVTVDESTSSHAKALLHVVLLMCGQGQFAEVKVAFTVPTETSVLYAIAPIASSRQAASAGKFVAFVQSRQAQGILAKYGFAKP